MKRVFLLASLFATGCAAASSSPTAESSSRKAQAVEKATPAAPAAIAPVVSGTWQTLKNAPPIVASVPWLLTDGTVIVQDLGQAYAGSPDFWRLTPDANGSYLNGTWSQLPSLPDGYDPIWFASAVLPDGRFIIEGGEYLHGKTVWTTKGAIFDPLKNQWTPVAPPAGWRSIGDAQSVILDDGRFMLADCCSTNAAILNPHDLTWTPIGTGKADIYDEEGWTLLPDGTVLTVDANNVADLLHSELFDPTNATWSSAGSTIVQLADLDPDYGGSHELGPQILRPDGSVFAIGATGHTAVYHPQHGTASGKWTAGPDFPTIPGEGKLDSADGPAALLPNGNVLISVSNGVFNGPAHIFEYNGKDLVEVAAPQEVAYDSSYNTNLLVLPTGEVLFTDWSNDLEIYSPTGSPKAAWAPFIEGQADLHVMKAGTTVHVEGMRFNGMSQGTAYGDDVQNSTNFPLVRIKNRATGHVVYARTHDHGTMSVGRFSEGSTNFDIPAGIELGMSDLELVANGIASEKLEVNVVK